MAKKKIALPKGKEEKFKKEALSVLDDLGILETKEEPAPDQEPTAERDQGEKKNADTHRPGMEYHKKVLIIDDNEEFRDLIKESISELDLTILEAENGKSGLDQVKKNPDLTLIFVDLAMPEVNGFQFLKFVRTLNMMENAKFIISSGYSEPKYIKKAKEYGVVGYLVKPIDPERILEIAKKLVSK